MSNKSYVVKIVGGPENFSERVDEILDNKLYEPVKHAVSQLKERLKVDPDLVALCAPQIGTNLRLFVVKTSGTNMEKFKAFINPMIVTGEGLHLSREVNPSFKGKQFIIPRKDKVHVAYQTPDGHVESETYVGVYGEVIQQMIEMLDGITLFDYGFDLDDVGGAEEFDKATKEEKEQVIQMYLESLKSISGELKEEIESNPELKKINDTINFTTRMLSGEIKPVDENDNIVEFKTVEEQMVAALETLSPKA